MEYLFMEKSPIGHQYLSTVRNEQNQICFILVGRIGRKNDQIYLYNNNRVKLGTITQKTTKIYPSFDLVVNNEFIGKLMHLGHLGHKDSYYLTKSKLTAFGDLKYQNYNIYSTKKIMSMHLMRNLQKETFQLALIQPDSQETCLLIAAVLNYLLVISEKDFHSEKRLKRNFLPQFRGSFFRRHN